MYTVDLSNTGISGTIPSWFWNATHSYSYINLCNNQLYGELPFVIPINHGALTDLCSNKFNGTLPRNSFAASELNLSSNSFSGDLPEALCHPKTEGDDIFDSPSPLRLIDFGGNLFSGKFPDCWMKMQSLQMINLGNNNLTGEIPSSMGSLQNLQSLHIRNNGLPGEIPSFLRNCTQLQNLDLGLNKLVGNITAWFGVLSSLVVLGVRSNKLNGKIPHELCHLTSLQILDAADNNFSGTIPSCFNNLSAMVTKKRSCYPITYFLPYVEPIEQALVVTKGREDKYDKILHLLSSLDLSNNSLSGEIPKQLVSLQGLISLNLSRNHLRGNVPERIGDMGSILSLDVSRNQLSGGLPASMSNLNFLSYLNVSFNNLSGEIPISTQLQSLDPSCFVGNRLCGPPLHKKCRELDPKYEEGPEEGSGDEEEYWFRPGVVVRFVVGFLGVISPLVLCGFWRRAYFWFFQSTCGTRFWTAISD